MENKVTCYHLHTCKDVPTHPPTPTSTQVGKETSTHRHRGIRKTLYIIHSIVEGWHNVVYGVLDGLVGQEGKDHPHTAEQQANRITQAHTHTDRQTDRHTHARTHTHTHTHTHIQNISFPYSLPSLPSPTHPTSILSKTTMISSTQQATRREPSFPSSSMLDVRSAPHWLQHRQQQVTMQHSGMHMAKIMPRMVSARMGAYHWRSCAGGEGRMGVSACTCEAIQCVCMHACMYMSTHTHAHTHKHCLTMFVYDSWLTLAGSVLRFWISGMMMSAERSTVEWTHNHTHLHTHTHTHTH